MNLNDAPIELADTKFIWSQVDMIKKDMDTKMKSKDIDTKYAEFNKKYPRLYKMVKSGADLNILKSMTSQIDDIKDGKKTYKKGMKSVAETIGKTFLPKDADMSKYVKDD